MNIKKNITEKEKIIKPNLDCFSINKVFLSSLLKSLWNYPEAMYHILLNSDVEVVQKDLASFIVNNFYCNHLSGNYMENNLLYVITMMLKDEINKLDNINQVDNFLENSKCGFLLEELQKMPDIQIYFKNVIQKTVETIERTSSFREITFNIADMQKELIELKKSEEKKIGKKIEKKIELDNFYNKIINSMVIDQSINHSTEENNKIVKKRNDMFISKYILDIKIDDIKGLCEKAEKQKNNDLPYLNDFSGHKNFLPKGGD